MISSTMQFFTCLSLFVVGSLAATQEGSHINGVKVLAYGSGISGLPVCMSQNGTALISDSPGLNNTIALKWNISTATSESWNVSAISTNVTALSSTLKFYIIPTDDAFSAAGFSNDTATIPSGAVTDGFVLYGSDVMYISDDKYLAQFWATPTETNDTYVLVWNSNGDVHDDAVPVNLKHELPASS